MEVITVNIFTKIKSWFDTSSVEFPSRLALFVCIIMALGGIILGFIEGSLAVQTNGLIAAIDIFNSTIFLGAVRNTSKSPDVVFNYGYGKYESISMLTAALMLGTILVYTLISAIGTFGTGEEFNGNYYLLLSFSSISFLASWKISKYLLKASKKYNIPILEYDSEIWRTDSLVEIGVMANLTTGAVLHYYGLHEPAVIIDSVTALLLIVYSLKIPVKGAKKALDQLLDRTLPDNIQYGILAVIAESFTKMCEFKAIHTRQSGKDIFIEIDIVMPYDFTLQQKFDLEKDISQKIREKYPTAVPRLYVLPCNRDCEQQVKGRCPVKEKKTNHSNNKNG